MNRRLSWQRRQFTALALSIALGPGCSCRRLPTYREPPDDVRALCEDSSICARFPQSIAHQGICNFVYGGACLGYESVLAKMANSMRSSARAHRCDDWVVGRCDSMRYIQRNAEWGRATAHFQGDKLIAVEADAKTHRESVGASISSLCQLRPTEDACALGRCGQLGNDCCDTKASASCPAAIKDNRAAMESPASKDCRARTAHAPRLAAGFTRPAVQPTSAIRTAEAAA
jgi:hypothetical protein